MFDDETTIPLLSLVAVNDEKITGHILFTKAVITQTEKPVSARILAPLAVHPHVQGRGVGWQLIKEGIEKLKLSEVELVFVLGSPDYYPRFGFIPAGANGFEMPYSILAEHAGAWMVQELCSGVIGRVKGKVRCSEVLNQPEYWRE